MRMVSMADQPIGWPGDVPTEGGVRHAGKPRVCSSCTRDRPYKDENRGGRVVQDTALESRVVFVILTDGI